MEQIITESRRRTVNQRTQEQAGQTLEGYGRFQLTGYTIHPIVVVVDRLWPGPSNYPKDG